MQEEQQSNDLSNFCYYQKSFISSKSHHMIDLSIYYYYRVELLLFSNGLKICFTTTSYYSHKTIWNMWYYVLKEKKQIWNYFFMYMCFFVFLHTRECGSYIFQLLCYSINDNIKYQHFIVHLIDSDSSKWGHLLLFQVPMLYILNMWTVLKRNHCTTLSEKYKIFRIYKFKIKELLIILKGLLKLFYFYKMSHF